MKPSKIVGALAFVCFSAAIWTAGWPDGWPWEPTRAPRAHQEVDHDF